MPQRRRCKRTAARDWARCAAFDQNQSRSAPSLSREPGRIWRASRPAWAVLVRDENMSPKYEDSFSFHRLFGRQRKREVYRAAPVFRSFNLIELARAGTQIAYGCYRPDILERTDMPTISPQLLPVLMLFVSNVFMTFAWYG